ncbi:MAG: hypothetical protein Q8920_05425 [Bacillota bacterium]|nr:hypothetical protein [Bacillota bacterium]
MKNNKANFRYTCKISIVFAVAFCVSVLGTACSQSNSADVNNGSSMVASSQTAVNTEPEKFDQRLIGTWCISNSELNMVIVISFKEDGTFKESIAICSSISNYAQITKGKFRIEDGKITYYGQTYAKANGYWKNSSLPDYKELGDIFIEGNLPAEDKTETISLNDDNHLALDNLIYSRSEEENTNSTPADQGNKLPSEATPSKNVQNQSTVAAASSKLIYHSGKFGFSLTFPESWRGKYVVKEDEESVQVYQKITYDSSNGEMGRLFSIAEFTKDEWNKNGDEISSISEDLGNVTNGDKVYYFGGPSDVQFDSNNKQAAEEYKNMHNDIQAIVKTFTFDK